MKFTSINQTIRFKTILYFWIYIFNCIDLNAQCPSSTFYISGNIDDFNVNTINIRLGTDLKINSNPNFSAAIKNTIKYRIGFYGSTTLTSNDFNCNGSTACTSNLNISLADDFDYKIVNLPDVIVGFNKTGAYSVIQTYVSGGINYYNCKTVFIYEEPEFTLKTCNCNKVFVNIPKSKTNDFFDEMEISFLGISEKVIVKKSEYGKVVNNTSPYPGYIGPGPCPAINPSKSIKVEGIRKISNSPDFRISDIPKPIDFSDNYNKAGIVHHAVELRHEANDDFIFESKNFVDILEVSYDGVSGIWSNIPAENYSIANAGKTFTINGIKALNNKEICFRGNSNNSCGGNTIPVDMRPVACMTGEITAISDDFNFNTANRDVIIKIAPYKIGGTANVVVNLNKTSENILSSSNLEFRNESVDCLTNEYRVKVSYNSATLASEKTYIYSKPKKYTLIPGTAKALPGILSASIKQTGYSSSEISSIIKHEKTFPLNSKINFYGSDANSNNFLKLNTTPINQNNFQDKALNLNLLSKCYLITYLDQCNFESLPTEPVCTTVLNEKSGTLEWNKTEVATNQPISKYLPIINYTVEEVECISDNCIKINSFPPTTFLNFKTDIVDSAPETKDFTFLRIKINTNPDVNSYSNIYKFYFPAKIYFPNSFTPNGDSINDVYKINGFHVGNFKMNIYDRWGVKVHTLNNINETWDGGNFESGAYIFEAEATDISTTANSKINQKGIFWLQR